MHLSHKHTATNSNNWRKLIFERIQFSSHSNRWSLKMKCIIHWKWKCEKNKKKKNNQMKFGIAHAIKFDGIGILQSNDCVQFNWLLNKYLWSQLQYVTQFPYVYNELINKDLEIVYFEMQRIVTIRAKTVLNSQFYVRFCFCFLL